MVGSGEGTSQRPSIHSEFAVDIPRLGGAQASGGLCSIHAGGDDVAEVGILLSCLHNTSGPSMQRRGLEPHSLLSSAQHGRIPHAFHSSRDAGCSFAQARMGSPTPSSPWGIPSSCLSEQQRCMMRL